MDIKATIARLQRELQPPPTALIADAMSGPPATPFAPAKPPLPTPQPPPTVVAPKRALPKPKTAFPGMGGVSGGATSGGVGA